MHTEAQFAMQARVNNSRSESDIVATQIGFHSSFQIVADVLQKAIYCILFLAPLCLFSFLNSYIFAQIWSNLMDRRMSQRLFTHVITRACGLSTKTDP